MNHPFRILSLDGGGSWAILQILALEEIFKRKILENQGDPDQPISGHFVLQQFDMVVANSGGSIVLAALAENKTLTECIEIFNDEENRNEIFKKLTFSKKYFPNQFTGLIGIGPRYSASAKRDAFNKLFPINNEKYMEELPEFIGHKNLELLVVAFDHQQKRGKIFRSNRNSKARPELICGNDDFDSVKLVQAIHASSNAPINYFDKAAYVVPKMLKGEDRKNYLMWDGALAGLNNPVELGITEALMNGVPREQIRVLSIGTGSKLQQSQEMKDTIDNHFDLVQAKNRTRGKKQKRFGFFKRLGIGRRYFMETFLGLAKSSMLEPPDWANYASFVMLFYDKLENKDYYKNKFVRLSPLIANFPNDNNGAEISELVNKLAGMDMDLTKKEDVDLLFVCFEKWKAGQLRNQPIHDTLTGKGKYLTAYGHQHFEEAITDWLSDFELREHNTTT